VVAMFLLCRHLAHGFSSVFQSIGLRTEAWQGKLDLIASGYAWLIFAGFSIIPISVLAQKHGLYEFYDPSFFVSEASEKTNTSNLLNNES